MLDEFGTARDTEVKQHSTQVLRLGDAKNAAATPPTPLPPPAREEQKKPEETPTRRIPTPKLDDPRRRVTDTTRLMLRGKTSTQENLAELPKSDNIVISSELPEGAPATAAAANTGAASGGSSTSTQPRPSDTTKRFRDTRALAAAKAGHKDTAAKSSDTGQKRRTAEQLAARNDIRVDLRKLDSMLDLVGELVIAEAMVTRHPVVWNADNESLERAVHQLRRVASSLQDMATSVRMIPLAPTFRRMTRLVYDLSVKAGKQVDLILLGEDTEVDRTVIERISDPLVHIIRNAIDHGIEPPDERVNLGKPETGRLTIEGHHEGGEVWIIISDDGRGLDREAILRRAISRGLIQGDGSDLTDGQIYHFIFEPGFSTAEKVTDISGRGFGMDVVKKNIEKLSGRIDIRTRPGEGTAVVLRIPLTLAIIDGMLVSSGDTQYIIPLLSIRESLRPDESQIMSTPDGQHMVKLRDELIPIVRLDEIFTRVSSTRSMIEGILMIVEGEDGDVVALFADELLGQQETVIKGLSGWLKRSRGVSGCTILGDGEVGLILDIGAIVRLARQQSIDFDAAAGGSRTGA
ncbi:MAG: chemotaxis protein CheA [Planctomycetes bacterium]|nr:chemotaxis protein CheA [Planctomycetota bacterium]